MTTEHLTQLVPPPPPPPQPQSVLTLELGSAAAQQQPGEVFSPMDTVSLTSVMAKESDDMDIKLNIMAHGLWYVVW